uniref:BRO1 domain-containing protein n=1 Tax=Trepomonas sp. PC1 TaxID=1076344 RepID=A0A146KIC5_9EUKA|eukprot:JAP95325.1 Hypothetical protein TPC1_11726 [Trepomonas sp. PC1]
MKHLTKDVNNEDREKLQKMADECNSARMALRGFNRLTIEQYRRYYETILPMLQSIPWNTKQISKALGKELFTYTYSRNLKNPMRQETSLSIDMVCTLYNCIATHSLNASAQTDLKTRAQEFAKATYYCDKAIEKIHENAHLLQNVDAHCGEGYFSMLKYMFDGQCAETQAIQRAQKSDLVGNEAAFNQFIGLMARAEDCYKRAIQLLAGIPGVEEIHKFCIKRQRSAKCALLYINGSYISSSKPGQALKDVMEAQDMVKDNDLVSFDATQQLVQVLMMQRGVVPAPQTSSFQKAPMDLSPKFVEWGLPLNEVFTAIPMVSKDEAEILNAIKVKVEAELNKTAVPESDKQAAVQAQQLITQMHENLQKSTLDIKDQLKIITDTPNLRQRLQSGAQFEAQLQKVNSSGQQVVGIYNQIIMADQDNIRRYGAQRWNSQYAMQILQTNMQQVQQLVSGATNQQQCIDYLKQYNDQQFDALFKYAQNAQNQVVDESLKEQLGQKVNELEAEVKRIQNPEPIIIPFTEVQRLLTSYDLAKKRINELTQVVLQGLKQESKPCLIPGIMQQIQDINIKIDAQTGVSAQQVKQFQEQIGMIQNLLQTLTSGEAYIQQLEAQIQTYKQKAASQLQQYRTCVEQQFPMYAQNPQFVLNINIQ